MREGVRDSMARLRASLGKAARPTLTALICAGACAPVIAAAAGAGLTLTAALGLLGSVGGNAISEFIADRLARLKGRDASAAEAALAEAFSEALQSDSADTAEVRRALTALLEQTGAFTIVIREAARDDDSELLEAVRSEFEHLAGLSEENHRLLLEQGARILELCRDQAASLSLQTTVRDTAQETLGVLVQLFQFVQYVAATPGAEHGTTHWDGNPYLGLQPFTTSDAPIFFGRTVTLAQLVAAAEAFVPGGSMIVTGPSGVGKSSLLRAGFAPAVEHGLFHEDPRQGPWRTVLLERPGERPITALATEFAKHGGPDSKTTERSLRDDPEDAAARVEERRNGPDGARPERLLILIDQAEELFTLANEKERNLFLRALESIARSPNAFTVLGIRSDHIDDCMAVPSLREAAQHRLFRVGPMTRDQMRQAITLPAAAAGVRIEERVVATLLEDLFGAKDTPRSPGAALPLMSQTMLLLWNEGRQDRHLTEAEYLAIGGVHRAVTTAAEAVYNGLDESERITSRHLFRRLVGAESADRLVRTEVAADSLTDAERAVATHFLDARLLVADAATVQIAHDILLEQWERLQKWMEPDLTARILLTRLEAAADQRKQGAGDLYSAASLAAITTDGEPRWETLGLAPTEDATEFLQQSRANARRADRDRRIRLATLSALTIIAMLIGLYTIYQNGELTDQRNSAVSQRLAAESIALLGTDGEQARLLAAAAWNLSETDEAYEALIRSANDPSTRLTTTETLDTISDLATSPDGAYAASTGASGRVTLWRTEGWAELETLATDGYFGTYTTGLEFSRDGALLASLTDSGVTVWDVASMEAVARLDTTGRGSLSLSPDATTLAIANDATVEIWDVATESQTAEYPVPEYATTIEFSPDGATLLISDLEGGFTEWNPATGETAEQEAPVGDSLQTIWASTEEPGRMLACGSGCYEQGPQGEWTALDFGTWDSKFAIATDGSMIASYDIGTLRIWDAETDTWAAILLPDTIVSRLELFKGGTAVAAATAEGIQTWDISSVATMRALNEEATSIAVAADAARVAVVGNTGFSVYAVPDAPLTSIVGEGLYLYSAAISHDGNVAGGSGVLDDEASLYLWDADTGEPLAPLPSDGGFIEQVAFSPEEDQVALVVDPDNWAVTPEDEIWIWDFAANEVIARVDGPADSPITSLAYSPDGEHLVTTDGDGMVRFRNSGDARETDAIEPISTGDRSLYNLTYSQDGRYLALDGLADVRLWDLETGEMQSTEATSTGGMLFTPDSRFLLVTDSENTNVWDIERGQLVSEVFLDEDVQLGGFLPDTWTLAGASGTWLVTPDMSFLTDPYGAVCERTDRDLTPEEWDEHLSEFDFGEVTTCP
ncbi:NACHT and WD repeat domain-containing protein [Glycomyces sp. NPDC047010]|uniref:NACHT and WD repeat domain-containing protein n=1 Tax=Glycomyces sp. NPDC047010 TaxID=3155023 RepID=UPI0033EA1F8C